MTKKAYLVTVLILIVTTLGIGVENRNLHKALESERNKEITVIENDNVKIEYIANGEQYDILVDAKGDTNISSEWEIKDGHNYRGAYLVGDTQDNREKFYNRNLEKLGIDWTWEY